MKTPLQSFPMLRLVEGLSRRSAIMSVGGAIALCGSAAAATATWTGGDGSDPNWSVAGNWSAAPLTGDDIVFSGVTNAFNTNDLNTAIGGTIAVNSLTFDAAAESFEIGGNPIFFNGKTIANNSTFPQVLNARLQENASGIVAAGTGELELLGVETNTFSHVFTKNGTSTVKVDGSYSTVDGSGGAPFQLTVNAGTLDWAGGIFGTVNVNANATLLSTNANWHYNTTLKLNNATSTVGFTINTALGEMDAVAGSTIKSLAGGGTTIIDFNQDPVTRINDIAGNLVDGDGGGRLGVLLGSNTGIPLVNLSGQNTYTGDTEVRTAGSKLNLLNGGKVTFKIEPDGVSNKIFGPGLVSLNGALDITGLDTVGTPAIGTKWVLVQSPSVTYGANFTVPGFTETSPGIWRKIVGPATWYFTKASGKLAFGVLPDSVWAGGSGGNWSTGANWTSLSSPVTNDLPTLTGSNTASNNDVATAWDTVNLLPGAVQLAGLRFDAAAGSFNLSGNELYLNSKTIQNLSANPQTISAGIGAGLNGFTVNTSAGDVILTGPLNNYDPTNSSNRALTKAGTGKLVLNGSQNQGWALNVTAGTLQVFNPVTAGKQVGSGGTISAGATLRTETSDTYTANASVAVNGTLDVVGGGESFGAVTGTGTVTNHGPGGGVALLSFQRNNTTWGGSIQDGGNVTAVAFTGTTAADTVTFTGHNRYTGDTTVGTTATFTLANGASMLFKPGSNGVSNKIAGTGTANLNGKLKLDLSAASPANGNSWSLVDVGALRETFGASFAVTDAAWISPAATKVNASANAIGDFVSGTSYVSGGNIYTGGSGPINLTGVTDPAPEAVYIAERYGNMTYTFGGLTIGNNYKVRLHFAEVFHNAANKRKFDVTINGVLQLDDYDIWVAAGNAQKKAVIEERTVAANASGAIIINFANVVDNGKICGIEIIDTRPGSPTPDFAKSGSVWTRTDGSKTWSFNQTTGVLSLAVAGGASNYSTWATANGISGEPGSSDHDHDGLSNLVEYALGKSPTVSSVPAGTYASGAVSFAKGAEAVANGDVTWAIEESDDLGVTDPWAVVTPAVNSPTAISYTLPAGKAKVFVRLAVQQP
ncbi:malectin domain-containing carbohydrate-binding protein [Luteolibacter soli]|uniref:Malectin domain-containing carbohydrate-binding protein n=1 Tax=Luteolibacter soli TaxID=3135280 RepID=A0ABU9AQ30_9BACT